MQLQPQKVVLFRSVQAIPVKHCLIGTKHAVRMPKKMVSMKHLRLMANFFFEIFRIIDPLEAYRN